MRVFPIAALGAFFLMLSISGVARGSRLEIDEREAGRLLLLGRGDMLTVTLPASPATGYSWTVSRLPAGLLQEIGKPSFESRPHRSGMVGAGGWQRWKFRAAGVGNAMLVFSYSRPWENGVTPARLIRWPVTIRR